MYLTYTVSAKVETLKMDGETTFMLHGTLSSSESLGDPLAMAMPVDEVRWHSVSCGDVLQFWLRDE